MAREQVYFVFASLIYAVMQSVGPTCSKLGVELLLCRAVDTRQNNWSAGQAGNTLESVLMGMGMDERHELLEILKEQQDAAVRGAWAGTRARVFVSSLVYELQSRVTPLWSAHRMSVHLCI